MACLNTTIPPIFNNLIYKVSFSLYDSHWTTGLLTACHTGEARGSFNVAGQGCLACECSPIPQPYSNCSRSCLLSEGSWGWCRLGVGGVEARI